MYLSKISIRQYISKFVSNSSQPSTKISPTASELILESRVDNIRGSVHDTDFAIDFRLIPLELRSLNVIIYIYL